MQTQNILLVEIFTFFEKNKQNKTDVNQIFVQKSHDPRKKGRFSLTFKNKTFFSRVFLNQHIKNINRGKKEKEKKKICFIFYLRSVCVLYPTRQCVCVCSSSCWMSRQAPDVRSSSCPQQVGRKMPCDWLQAGGSPQTSLTGSQRDGV